MRQLLRRAWYLLHQRQRDRDLADEMAFHRDMTAQHLESRGVDSDEAADAARRAFGSTALAADRSRDVWVWRWLEDGWRDLRFATTRLLVKERGFTAVAVITLGVGIGVNNTLFIAVNTACLRGLPIERPDRVLFLGSRDARQRQLGVSRREFDQARDSLGAFTALAAFANTQFAIGDEGGPPDREAGTYISSTAFHLLGEAPALGRDFLPSDDRPGAAPVAILSQGLWNRRYAADPSVIGRTIRVDGKAATVIGVMHDPFQFPGFAFIWLPLAQLPPGAAGARSLSVIGRLSDTQTMAQARSEIDSLSSRLAHEFPETNEGMRLTAVPINERYSQRITDPQWLAFLGLGAIIVLIACANVANLLLMRAMRRAHEMATRASLGATRAQLTRQLLIESALLATLGGALGLLCAFAGARALQRLIPANMVSYWLTFTMDARTLIALCVVCLGTVFVFGLAPTLHVARADVNAAMKAGGRSGAPGPRERRWTTAFLVAEFGLTLMFMAALFVSLRNMVAAHEADLVIHPANLITAWVTLPGEKYRTADQRAVFYEQLEQRMASTPRVSAVAAMTAIPLGGGTPRQIAVDGQTSPPGANRPTVFTVSVTPRAFNVLGVSLVAGRALEARDGMPGNEHVVINQRLAEMFFPGVDPIGRRVALFEPNPASGLRSAPGAAPPTGSGAAAPVWLTIAGVAPSIRQGSGLVPDPIAYLPLRASPPATAAIVIRGSGEPGTLAPGLREAVQSLDPDLPLYRLMSMEQALDESQWAARGSIAISLTIVWIAIGLAGVGLYAVTAHSVVQRSREIGVRIALGAGTVDIVRLIGRRVCVQVGLGTVAGIAFTWIWQKVFEVLPSGTSSPAAPSNIIGGALVFAIVAMVASAIPLLRATRVDPLDALRCE